MFGSILLPLNESHKSTIALSSLPIDCYFAGNQSLCIAPLSKRQLSSITFLFPRLTTRGRVQSRADVVIVAEKQL